MSTLDIDTSGDSEAPGRNLWWTHVGFTLLLVATFTYGLVSPMIEGWPLTARMFPVRVSAVGLATSGLVLLFQLWAIVKHRRSDAEERWPELGPAGPPLAGVLRHSAWLIGLTALLYALGFLPAAAIYTFAYLLVEARVSVLAAVSYTVVLLLAMMVSFGTIFNLVWPQGEFDILQRLLLDTYGRLGSWT